MDSTSLLQQNPPALNWGCQLTQVVLYNGHKMVVVVVAKTVDNTYRVTYVLSLSAKSFPFPVSHSHLLTRLFRALLTVADTASFHFPSGIGHFSIFKIW